MIHIHPLAPLRYSMREVQRLLGLSRSTLYARIADGKLAIQKDGRRTFVLASELDRYLGTGESLTGPPTP